eukprot:tig00000451_g964.t1
MSALGAIDICLVIPHAGACRTPGESDRDLSPRKQNLNNVNAKAPAFAPRNPTSSKNSVSSDDMQTDDSPSGRPTGSFNPAAAAGAPSAAPTNVVITTPTLRLIDIKDVNGDRIHFYSTVLIADDENPTLAFHGMPPISARGRSSKETDNHSRSHVRHESLKELVASVTQQAFAAARIPEIPPVDEVFDAILGIGYSASTFVNDRKERLNARPVLFAALPRKYADVLVAMSKDLRLFYCEHPVCVVNATATREQVLPISELPKNAFVLLMMAPKGRRPWGSLNIHHWEVYYVSPSTKAPFALRLCLPEADFLRYANGPLTFSARTRWATPGPKATDIRFRLMAEPTGELLGKICFSAGCIMDDPYGHPWTNDCPKERAEFIKSTAAHAAAKADDLARTRTAVNADDDGGGDEDDNVSVSTTASAVRRFSLFEMQRPEAVRQAILSVGSPAATAVAMPPSAPRQQHFRESKRTLALKAADEAARKAVKRLAQQQA